MPRPPTQQNQLEPMVQAQGSELLRRLIQGHFDQRSRPRQGRVTNWSRCSCGGCGRPGMRLRSSCASYRIDPGRWEEALIDVLGQVLHQVKDDSSDDISARPVTARCRRANSLVWGATADRLDCSSKPFGQPVRQLRDRLGIRSRASEGADGPDSTHGHLPRMGRNPGRGER
jgi:hypothetical protein